MSAGAFIRSGKVRDLYAVGEDRLLLVSSDRLSAFDVVLPTTIPDKGRVLTGVSRFWFDRTADLVPNHVLSTDPAAVPPGIVPDAAPSELRGRMLLCRRVTMLPVEVVVRGYLSGSGWKSYLATGAICGVRLPAGLRESDRLPTPVFTPTTKADLGEHDAPLEFDGVVDALVPLVGPARAEALADEVRELALAVFRRAADHCAEVGLLLADTKLELGLIDGRLVLADEVLTPDSSRFWDAEAYAPGRAQASFDKQPVRDWLEARGWDKNPPGPELPAAVVADTRARYVTAFERITGASFERYLREDVVSP